MTTILIIVGVCVEIALLISILLLAAALGTTIEKQKRLEASFQTFLAAFNDSVDIVKQALETLEKNQTTLNSNAKERDKVLRQLSQSVQLNASITATIAALPISALPSA